MVPRSPLHGGEMALYQVRRAGDSPRPSLSTFAVLPPPTPGAGSGNGSPRASRPPELPAGKRGGWHHDSVYPSFRLTSFAPRAVNFAPECTSRKVGAARNYTFRSMPRTNPSRAQPKNARETAAPSTGRALRIMQASSKRLNKRVVQKPDGRYLIYYERSPEA